MLLAILEAIISGIVIEMIFNAWHKRHQISDIIQRRGAALPAKQEEEEELAGILEEASGEAPAHASPKPTQPASAPAHADTQSLLKQLRPFRIIARIFISGLTGFIIGGLVAGIVEAETAREIALGSGESYLYIGIPMALTWLLLWSVGPLKRVATD